MTSTSGPPDEAWTPAFDGQRPPFTPGHTQSTVHGAFSERRVGPLAAQIAGELLTDPDTPAHLHEPLFASAVHAWARAEAIVQLLWRYLEDTDIAAAMTETTKAVETEETVKRQVTRKTTGERVASALSELHRAETRAANARARLGLDPASAARIGKDLATRRYLEATPLDTAVAAIARQRAALTSGNTDGDSSDNGTSDHTA